MDKKFQKRKERERRVRKKILLRRETMRKQKKAEAAKEEAFDKEYKESLVIKSGKTGGKTTSHAAVIEQLKKNLKILEGLDAEYQAEMNAKKEASKLTEFELLEKAGIEFQKLKENIG